MSKNGQMENSALAAKAGAVDSVSKDGVGLILAVDAGFTATGYAVVRGGAVLTCGCIRTEPTKLKHAVRKADDDVERCQLIARQLKLLTQNYPVQGLLVELPTGGGQSARAVACMSKASAVMATFVELMGLPTEWITPTAVKLITGRKDASKEDVEKTVLARWPDVPLPKAKCEREHVTDALGVYIAAEHGTLARLINGGNSNG